MSGRGTSSGVVFQAEVGASVAGLLLTERPISRLGQDLPGTPVKLFFETQAPVDDILIKTDCGYIYVQAKRTVSLSARSDSELASVADQFVRQFHLGIQDDSNHRSFQPTRDRLLLAVGIETNGSVANHLREALNRQRTGAATGVPAHLTKALRTFTELIEAAWLRTAGQPITPSELQALLAVCSVVVFGDSQWQLATEALRAAVAIKGQESIAFDLLKLWAADAAQQGTGGGAAAIRQALLGKVQLLAPPSYQNDLVRLAFYSAATIRRLQRFAAVAAPERSITIRRPLTDLVIRAAGQGSLVLIGEPGAGKSALICQLAQDLSQESLVITLTIETGALTLDALSREIGLVHPLVEVLQQEVAAKPAYLLLDALDAVRGGLAEATYRRLTEEVAALSHWRVIASIRTFDLRLGREWRRLFEGIPPLPEYADASFPTVRHVQVSLLDEQEKAAIALQSPLLAAAISAGGPKLEALARNFFNLSLLSDLLRGGSPASSLATVATRGELLERYWQERIADLGTLATVSLKSVVAQLIASQSLDLPITEIPISAAAAIDPLQLVGVLVTEATQRIGFRHHVLFDYAVARLLLLPDQNSALRHLVKGTGLLISPSLDYWLEELKKRASPSEFWFFVVTLVGNEQVDPLVRIGVARLAVESVQPQENLALLAVDTGRQSIPTQLAFGQLAGAVLTRVSLGQTVEVKPWAELLARLPTLWPEQLGTIRSLIGGLLDSNPDPEAMSLLGVAARRLFDSMSTSEQLLQWLAPQAITYVARTYGTNPIASRERLIQLFASERFERFGYLELPWLAQQVLGCARHDADLTTQLFYHVFRGGNFSRKQETPLSRSWIMPMSSNAAQDFAGAARTLVRMFPELLSQFPRVATRALGAALHGVSASHFMPERQSPVQLPVGFSTHLFSEDGSYIWAWELEETKYADYAKLYQHFAEWIPTLNDQALLAELPNLLLQETGTALAWRVLFTLAISQPEVLGRWLWRAAAALRVLLARDTRQSAIALIATVYPYLTPESRAEVEAEWLRYPFAECAEPAHTRNQVLGTLFNGIGAKNLGPAAQDFLFAAKAVGSSLENIKPFALQPSSTIDSSRFKRSEAATDGPVGSPLLARSAEVRVASEALKALITPTLGTTLWQAIKALEEALPAAATETLAEYEWEASEVLAEGLGLVLVHGYVPTEAHASALTSLLALTQHPVPQPDAGTEESFTRFPSWSSPAPRVAAAKALAELVSIAGYWPLIRARFTALVTDVHPAVRLQMLPALAKVGSVDQEAMWQLATSFATSESNNALLQYGAGALAGWRGRAPALLEPVILTLAERVSSADKGNDYVTGQVVSFAIYAGYPASQRVLRQWISNYKREESRLSYVLTNLQEALVLGFSSSEVVDQEIRGRALAFVRALMTEVEPTMTAWSVDRSPNEKEVTAVKLFNEIAEQLYYAVVIDDTVLSLATTEAKRRFLTEYSPLIARLTALGTPKTVHHLLEVLSQLIAAAPAQCFDLLSAAILRKSGIARYEQEGLGAALFVELISLYIADYRAIFTDLIRRTQLIDCLALFVEAGWPEVRQLSQRLPELM